MPVKIKDFVENYLKIINRNISLNFGYYPYPDYEPMKFWGHDAKIKKIAEHQAS